MDPVPAKDLSHFNSLLQVALALWILFCASSAWALGPRWYIPAGCLAGIAIAGYTLVAFPWKDTTNAVWAGPLIPPLAGWICSILLANKPKG